MSWTGFKKAINRAGTQVMLKTGSMEQTVDIEYDYEEKRFKTMELHSIKLHKDLKKYLESLKLLANAQANIGEVISSFYGKADEDSFALVYNSTLKLFNEEELKEIEQPYNQTVLNPIARFNSYYIDINEAIKKRARKKVDYDAMKNKVRKLVEKPDASTEYESKLDDAQINLVTAEKVYNDVNSKLKSELPKLINLRIPYLDPSFEAFVKIQLRYFNENYTKLNQLQQKLDAKTRENYINGNLDNALDSVLEKMRELNIASV